MKSRKPKKQGNDFDNNPVIRSVFLILIILFLGILVASIGYTVYKNAQVKKIFSSAEINTLVEVVDYPTMGLNGDRDSLNYGIITAGNNGARYLNLTTKEDAIVKIYITGDMAGFLSVDDPEFEMTAGSYIKLPFYINVPADAQPGNYTGKIIIQFSRP